MVRAGGDRPSSRAQQLANLCSRVLCAYMHTPRTCVTRLRAFLTQHLQNSDCCRCTAAVGELIRRPREAITGTPTQRAHSPRQTTPPRPRYSRSCCRYSCYSYYDLAVHGLMGLSDSFQGSFHGKMGTLSCPSLGPSDFVASMMMGQTLSRPTVRSVSGPTLVE